MRVHYGEKLSEMLSSVLIADQDTLLMSRRNCHAKGVSSIVVGIKPSGSLVRYFLTWGNSQLSKNRPGENLVVGIHDHRYNLAIHHTFGNVVNVRYEICDDGPHSLYEHRFVTAMCNGLPEAKSTGWMVKVKETERTRLEACGAIGLGNHALHTIEAGDYAAWKVTESPILESKPYTTLLTEKENVALDGGLYGKFDSALHVVQHVLSWAGWAVWADASGGAK